MFNRAVNIRPAASFEYGVICCVCVDVAKIVDDDAFSFVNEIWQRRAARSLIWRGGRPGTWATTACSLLPAAFRHASVKGKNAIQRTHCTRLTALARVLYRTTDIMSGGCVVTKQHFTILLLRCITHKRYEIYVSNNNNNTSVINNVIVFVDKIT